MKSINLNFVFCTYSKISGLMNVMTSCITFSITPNIKIGPNALQSGRNTDAIFFFLPLLKSTSPDDFLKTAFAPCVLEN